MAASTSRRVVETDLDDLANVEFETSDNVEVVKSFDSMGLKEDLIRGIFAYGKSSSVNQDPLRDQVSMTLKKMSNIILCFYFPRI